MFLVGAVDIDVALERIAAGPLIDAGLEAVQRQDSGEDQILLARLARPHAAGGLPRAEFRAGLHARADAGVNAVPAKRRAVGPRGAADADRGRRDRELARRPPPLEQRQ